jgi:hypothetical protein
MLQLAFRRLHRLAQEHEGLQCIVQSLPALLKPILNKDLRLNAARAVIQLRAVDG